MKALDKALKALENGSSLEEKQNRILAIVYLHFNNGYDAAKICLHGCALKLNTIKGYFKKYYYRLTEALNVFFDDVIETLDTIILHHDDFLKKNSSYSEGYCAYIVECFNNKDKKFLKIGMTKDFNRRMRQHLKNPKYHIDGICVRYILPCYSEEDAKNKEDIFRDFYQKFFTLTPKDRFYEGFFIQSDIQAIAA